jgi:hypothetical protein
MLSLKVGSPLDGLPVWLGLRALFAQRLYLIFQPIYPRFHQLDVDCHQAEMVTQQNQPLKDEAHSNHLLSMN